MATGWLSLVLLALAMLTGCASQAPGPPTGVLTERLSGRLALQVDGQPERSISADFELTGSARAGELTLSGPLGTTGAKARWSPTEAVLSTPQGESREADLDALTQRALGEPLPVGAWFDWLRGRPWPAAPATALTGSDSGFEQLGWRVILTRQADGLIEARRLAPPAVTVRVKLSSS